jgi:hypothetical protein
VGDVSTLLDRLIDDAATFPPGDAPLDVAVRDHQQLRASAYASLIGPLLVRDVDAVRLAGLTDQPLEIGVIVTSGSEGLDQALAHSPWITVAAVEARELTDSLRSLPDGITVSVELPRPGADLPAEWIAAADEIAAAGFQAKFRTGGVTVDAYPDEAELAAVLGALVHGRFKLTAGLHRAVRNTQPGTGFEQHGFVNVMVAVHRLLSGAAIDEVAGVLAERDGPALAAIVRSWTDEDAVAVRRTFRGFGSCSITEPYADLVELGLV